MTPARISAASGPPCPTLRDDDSEERRVGRRPGWVVLGQGVRGLGCRPGAGPPGGKALAAHGADLVLAARRQSTLDDVFAEVSGMGARAIVVPTDITDPEACARLMAAGVEEFGGIDVLVNNAFRFDAFKSFEEVDLAIWRKIMDTNLFGSLQMTRAALPAMRGAVADRS